MDPNSVINALRGQLPTQGPFPNPYGQPLSTLPQVARFAMALSPEEESQIPGADAPGAMQQPYGMGSGSPGKVEPVESPAEKAIGDIVTKWAQGKATPKDVRNVLGQHGWSMDNIRGQKYDVEVFDPSGKAHYISP